MVKTFIICEVGINANGDLDIAKKLIDAAVAAGCDAVKFQKRTVNVVYSKEELDILRESPWGTTNRQQKEGLEFSFGEYIEIDKYCTIKNIPWFFSAWDTGSLGTMNGFGCKYNKIASAMLGDLRFCEWVAAERKHTFISTGMSEMSEITAVVEIFKDQGCSFELMHCNSVYPMNPRDANLEMINVLGDVYECDVGYSGHESGLIVSCAAVAMGATSIERHITLDRTMYGSDQPASIEPDGLKRLVRYIRTIEESRGNGIKTVSEAEREVRKKLRYYEK